MGCFDFAPKPVDQPSYAQQTSDILLAQSEREAGTGRFAQFGPLAEMEAKYQPAYTRNALAQADIAVPGVLDLLQRNQPAIS